MKEGKGKVIRSKLENLWEKYYQPLHRILKKRDAQGLFGTEHWVYDSFRQRIRDINFATACGKIPGVCFTCYRTGLGRLTITIPGIYSLLQEAINEYTIPSIQYDGIRFYGQVRLQ